MLDLVFQVKQLCTQTRRGSYATRADRERILKSMASEMATQFPGLQLKNLALQHVRWYVTRLMREASSRTGRPLGVGTQKNRLAAIRWLLRAIGKQNLLASDNDSVGVARRSYVASGSKAVDASDDLIEEIALHNQWAAASLRLTREFGLRVEESLKFIAAVADLQTEIRLARAWCKNGVSRSIPLRTAAQRFALDAVLLVAGTGSLIPPEMSYVEHLRRVRELLSLFGLHSRHGLRHQYAQSRYFELTGLRCPVQGGPQAFELTEKEYRNSRAARQTVTYELGHSRASIVSVYLGSMTAGAAARDPYLDSR